MDGMKSSWRLTADGEVELPGSDGKYLRLAMRDKPGHNQVAFDQSPAREEQTVATFTASQRTGPLSLVNKATIHIVLEDISGRSINKRLWRSRTSSVMRRAGTSKAKCFLLPFRIHDPDWRPLQK